MVLGRSANTLTAHRHTRASGVSQWEPYHSGALARRLATCDGDACFGSQPCLGQQFQVGRGANAVCEVIACGVPVLSSHIAGSIGLLEEDYSGDFEVGDMAGLTGVLRRFEMESNFRAELTSACLRLASQATPARELAEWQILLASLP